MHASRCDCNILRGHVAAQNVHHFQDPVALGGTAQCDHYEIRDARGDLRPLQDAHLSGLVVDLLRLVPRHPQEQIAQGLSAFLL
jgi:hypothetical protein